MGWWKIGSNHELIMGDETADDVINCLNNIADIYNHKAKELPSFMDYLQIIKNTILSGKHEVEDNYLQKNDLFLLSITQKGENYKELLTEAEEVLNYMLDRIENSYRSSIERKPYFAEIIANLLFGLSAEPARYLSDQTGIKEVEKLLIHSTNH